MVNALLVLDLVDVVTVGGLILVHKVMTRLFGEPRGEFCELLPEPVHRLLIHVGLGDEFRQ